MEISIQSSDNSDSDGYIGWPEIHRTRRRHLQRKSTNQGHRRSLKVTLIWITRIRKTGRVNVKKVKYGKGLDNLLPREMINPQPEENILIQTEVSM